MNDKISNCVVLDFGSSKIACLAAFVGKRGEIKIVSQNLYHSKGLRSGVILDLKNAETSLLTAIYALEKDCGKSIKKVLVSLSGAATKSYYVHNQVKLANQTVTEQDVKKLLQKALSAFKVKGQEIIHYFPLEFSLDNHYVENPVGMHGAVLGCELHIIAASSNMLANLVHCFAQCHVEVTGIALAIYASGMACLSRDEQEFGSLVIDMGDKTTSFGIFFNSKLIYIGHIDIGSFHISADIAKVFGVDFATAEKLKILYGNAIISPFDKDSIINIDEIEHNDASAPRINLTIYNLSEVINSRVEEILLLIKNEYDKPTKGQMIAYRIVITGGGSALRGVKELAGRIFEKQIRLGKPELLDGFAEDYNPSIYSTAIGMLKVQSLKQQRGMELNENNSLLKKIIAWLKENV